MVINLKILKLQDGSHFVLIKRQIVKEYVRNRTISINKYAIKKKSNLTYQLSEVVVVNIET